MNFFLIGFSILIMQTSFFALAEDNALQFGQVINIPHQNICSSIILEVYKKLEIPIKINLLPGRRSIIETSKENIDGEVCRSEEFASTHSNILKITPAIYFANPKAFARKKLKLKNYDINSFAKYRIGIIKGIPGIEKKTAHIKSITIVNTIEQLVQMLLQDRIDLFITSEINTKVTLKNMKIDSEIKYIYPINKVKVPLFHFIIEKHKLILPKIQNTIIQMQKSGELISLQKKFEQEELHGLKK